MSLRNRLGRATYPALLLAVAIFAVRNLLGIFRLVGRSACPGTGPFIIATIPSNESLIRMAAQQVPEPATREPLSLANARFRLRSLDRTARLTVAVALLRLYGSIWRNRDCRLSLALHVHDALDMLVLAAFAHRHRGEVFWTECHYQRWSFILSKSPCQLHLVQHGPLDDGIALPNDPGTIALLALQDPASLDVFRRLYKVKRWFTYHNTRPFDDLEGGPVLLLASSAPYVDAEIELLIELRGRIALPIAVKLHPAHHYDQRGQRLLALADIRVPSAIRPSAAVFVSWNSSMEIDYQAARIPTFSIERCGGVQSTVTAIVTHLPAVRATPA